MISSANSVQLTPLHFWREVPFWSLFRRVKEINYPDEELLSVYRDHGVVPTASRDDNFNKPSLDLSGYQLVRKGALVTNKMKAWQGSIAISRHRGIVSPAYYVYKPLSREHDQYLHYLLRSQPFVALYKRISKGMRVNQWDLEHEALRIVPIPLPDLPTQKAIADFLDRETARIDQLIEKKQRMVEVLGEKRQAVISHAVTKGLDPDVPMKDSGVEWIGKIPTHWEVRRLKHLLTEPLKYGANEPADHIDPDLPRYIRITDIQENGTLRGDSFRSLPEEISKPYLLTEGDILFARSGATVGKIFRYDPSWGRAAYAGYLIRARLDVRTADSKFVEYVTRSQGYSSWLLCNLIQATIQNVSAERYASFRMPFPIVAEQRAIAVYLNEETANIDDLVAKIRETIDRLREFRPALITAAVTGQIDVSTWGKRGTTARCLEGP